MSRNVFLSNHLYEAAAAKYHEIFGKPCTQALFDPQVAPDREQLYALLQISFQDDLFSIFSDSWLAQYIFSASFDVRLQEDALKAAMAIYFYLSDSRRGVFLEISSLKQHVLELTCDPAYDWLGILMRQHQLTSMSAALAVQNHVSRGTCDRACCFFVSNLMLFSPYEYHLMAQAILREADDGLTLDRLGFYEALVYSYCIALLKYYASTLDRAFFKTGGFRQRITLLADTLWSIGIKLPYVERQLVYQFHQLVAGTGHVDYAPSLCKFIINRAVQSDSQSEVRAFLSYELGSFDCASVQDEDARQALGTLYRFLCVQNDLQ